MRFSTTMMHHTFNPTSVQLALLHCLPTSLHFRLTDTLTGRWFGLFAFKCIGPLELLISLFFKLKKFCTWPLDSGHKKCGLSWNLVECLCTTALLATSANISEHCEPWYVTPAIFTSPLCWSTRDCLINKIFYHPDIESEPMKHLPVSELTLVKRATKARR